MEHIPSPAPSPTTAIPGLHYHHHHMMSAAASNPKILQNLLYGQQYFPNGYPQVPYFHMHSHHHHLDDPFRPRSGSLQSLGSTASSHRPDRSPSRESNSSHDSLVLGTSPISIAAESPSPSPPGGNNNESKLFNILKGNVSSPFAGLFSSPKPSQPSPQRRATISNTGDATLVNSVHRRQILLQDSTRHEPYYMPPSSKKQTTSNSIAMMPEIMDGPMDLSCKPRRSKMETMAPRRFTMPAETASKAALIRAKIIARTEASKIEAAKLVQSSPAVSHANSLNDYFLEPISPPPRVSSRESVQSSDESAGGSSILRSILCGGSGAISAPPLSPRLAIGMSPNRERQVMSAPASPATHSFSEPASPLAGLFNHFRGSSPSEQNQRVTIAKKTLFPVRARVTDWINKTVHFAKKLPEFSSLSESDQVTLLNNAWVRILLIFMAENHFEFAVTPVLVDFDNSTNSAKDTGLSDVPTMKSVDCLQSFIKKCQNMALDATEYECIKTALFFNTGSSGIVNKSLIEEMSTLVRHQLQVHVKEHKPYEKMRYSSILLLLHTLSGISTQMVQNLFCKHILTNETMDMYIENLLKKQNEG